MEEALFYIFYLGPAGAASMAGVVLCGLALPHRPVLGGLAGVAVLSFWIWVGLAVAESWHLGPFPRWLEPSIGYVSMFGPLLLFLVVAGMAFSSKELARRSPIRWLAVTGLAGAILHTVVVVPWATIFK